MTNTKKEYDDLCVLKQKTEAFTSLAFDWVKTLGQEQVLTALYDFAASIEKKVAEIEALPDNYWEWHMYGSKKTHGTFATYEQAVKDANETYEESCCADEEPGNGDEFESDVVYIQYTEDGEELRRINGTVYYQHYHGDFAEHNTLYKGGCL